MREMREIKEKTLVVASEVQKRILDDVLLQEIKMGFWKSAKPSSHVSSWKGVKTVIGENLGPSGFSIPRNYNFVNPDFFDKNEQRLLESAKKVSPDITPRQLKKQLIFLNQILGLRVHEIGGDVRKLKRGKKNRAGEVITTEKKNNNVVIKKMLATIVE